MFLKVSHLCKEYQSENRKPAVNNVSFSLEKNDFACIMGKSGSGKTTLLNMIAGITTPTKGKIIINNQDISFLDDKNLSFFRNQNIGYIPQESSLLSSLNAIQNICLPYYVYDKHHQKKISIQEKALKLLNEIGIAYLKEAYPNEMSGGEARRVSIIRSLMCSPQLILADEPTNDLDDESAKEIMNLLIKINKQGSTILIVTHDKDVANCVKKQFKMTSGQLI